MCDTIQLFLIATSSCTEGSYFLPMVPGTLTLYPCDLHSTFRSVDTMSTPRATCNREREALINPPPACTCLLWPVPVSGDMLWQVNAVPSRSAILKLAFPGDGKMILRHTGTQRMCEQMVRPTPFAQTIFHSLSPSLLSSSRQSTQSHRSVCLHSLPPGQSDELVDGHGNSQLPQS